MTENWQVVIVALIAGLPGIIAAFASFKGNRKIDVVHGLVNSRLTEATDKLAAEITRNDLLQELLIAAAPKDQAVKELLSTIAVKNGSEEVK